MPSLSPTPLTHLRHGPFIAALAPAAGGRVASFSVEEDGEQKDLLLPLGPGPFDSHQWPKAGAFPMAPFANRLPRGGFRFDGRHVDPQPGIEGFPVHGFVHRGAWNLLDHADGSALIGFEHDGQGEGWPWAFSIRQRVTLDDRGLEVRMTLRNVGPDRMPFGMGWHPYHPSSPEAGLDDAAFEAQERLPLDDEGRAGRGVSPAPHRMAPGETAAFRHWAGRVQLSAGGQRLHIEASGWDHLVMHRPLSCAYLCVEPVTLLPGALALEVLPAAAVLLPQEERSATWRCSLVPVGPARH